MTLVNKHITNKITRNFKLLGFLLLLCLQSLKLAAQADFNVSPDKGCTPLSVKFTDNSTGAVSWNWDLGNGNTSTLQNPSAIYYNPGKYTVKLTIKDNSGKTFTVTKTNVIRAFKSPKADFSASPTTICLGEKVSFTQTSSPGDTLINRYSWDMGDGTVLNTKNPNHVFGASGLYTISLVVIDANGCQDKIQKLQYIKVNPKPVAQFKMDSAYDCKVPTFIPFKNNSTGNNLKYTWYFGDGSKSNLANPRHQYNNLGTYSPKLVVEDVNGCKDSITLTNSLFLGPLKPDFVADKTIICGSAVVEFDNKTVFNGGLKYLWDFGDGSTSSNPYPSKFYNKVGVYSVKLTVQSVFRSCTATITKNNYIVVNPKPNGKIELSDSFPCKIPFTTVAKYVDTAGFTSIQWWLVDNGNKTRIKYGTSNPMNFTINSNSKYTIIAYVVNKFGCLDSFKYENLQVQLTNISVDGNFTGCVPLFFKGIAKVSSNRKIMGIQWLFEDRDQYSGSSVLKAFLDTGVFKGTINVTVEKDCPIKYDFKIHVGQKVNPKFFTLPVGEICNNTDGINFINATQYPGFTIDSFKWIFDDYDPRNKMLKVTPWNPLPRPYTRTNVWHYYDRDTGWLKPALIGYHHGCPDTVYQIDSIKIKAAYARIELDYNICIKGDLIVKNASSAYTNWLWTINGKNYYTDTVNLNPYKSYKIQLKVWDSISGCWDTVSRMFWPMTSPNLDSISILNQELCAPGFVTLLAKHSAQKIQWTINGKDTAFGINEVTFKFDTAGIYNIEANFIYSKYCSRFINNKFIVGESNLKGSIVLPKSCLPSEIVLYDSSYKPGKKHAWVLSNGDTIKVTNFESKFTIKNSFKDTIWARLISDGSLVICEPSTVIPIPVSGPGFKSRLIWQHTCSTSILKGYLDKKRINANYTYSWDMGDGKKYSTQNISHQFNDSGYYTINITVTDPSTGCAASESHKVYFPGQRLKVNVNYTTVGTKCPPLLVHFRDSSTSGGVSIVKWNWDFGDNSFSVLKNPSHQYVNPGKYSIRLTITDSLGCTATRLFLYLILVPGPDGKFSFGPKNGCLPLTVMFADSVNNQTKKKEWDFGDGEVLLGNQTSHQYKQAGRYIPSMILEDSFGCKRSIKPKDTIVVYDLPQAQFTSSAKCLRDSVAFVSTATCSDAKIKDVFWEIQPENKAFTGNAFTYKFKNKFNSVKMIVKSENLCADTMSSNFKLFQPDATLNFQNSIICLGGSWLGSVTTHSDTILSKSFWMVDGKFLDTVNNLNFTPTKSGVYKVQYYIEDTKGCWDTASNGLNLKVGDTVVPLSPIWRRVSVLDDVSHELVWKEYPSFDFKEYNVFQDKGSGYIPIQKITGQKDTFLKINGVDALHRSDCYKVGSTNLCGYTQEVDKIKNHCTVELRGSPGLNVSVLNWGSYVGWPVERYVIYRQIDQGNFDSIGQVDGSELRFVDTNIRCYKIHHYRVKAHEKGGLYEFSWSDTCHVAPVYWNKVKPPTMRRATVLDDQEVRVEWQQLEKNKIPLERFVIVGKHGYDGLSEYKWVLNANNDSLRIFDRQIEVDQNFGVYKVLGIDECGDSSIFSSIAQSILLKVDLNSNFYPSLKWTKYLDWQEGVKEYIVERRTAGAFSEIQRVSGNDTFYVDELPNFNCLPNLEYRITAVRNKVYGLDSTWYFNSVSNIDDPGVETKVFIPNAFTPNKNELNEVFKPQGIYMYQYSMKIYNRWGEKLYDAEGCDHGWDGKYMGNLAPEGVYVYQVNVKGADGKLYPFFGDVTLLR